jgi:predicted nucleic acid-binding protein
MIAIDTNILVGSIQTFDPVVRNSARRAVKSLHRDGEKLFCFTQNLVEFWNVSTRPSKANGLGLSPEQAGRYVDRFQTIFELLPDIPEIFAAWRKLVAQHQVSGIQVHDARIVAAMAVYRVSNILTYDLDDFRRYLQITVIHPSTF